MNYLSRFNVSAAPRSGCLVVVYTLGLQFATGKGIYRDIDYIRKDTYLGHWFSMLFYQHFEVKYNLANLIRNKQVKMGARDWMGFSSWFRVTLLLLCFAILRVVEGVEQAEVYKRQIVLEECSAGSPGPAGPPGPPGPDGESGAPSPVTTNWKQCSWSSVNDGRDSGLFKSCSFTKEYSDTAIYVSWSGNLRLSGSGTGCCRWYFAFDGVECSNPNKIEAVVYASGYNSYNLHRPRVMMGYCYGIGAGSVTVGFYVGQCSGYGTYDCYTGWISGSHIMIEEVTKSSYD
ncbi:collagen triple helix repeat-containing protein 1 [Strongylocentrotus purpuratus]|uniref:CTHRC1 C-terminal domain-containing protein n=1 Tax=Strongylocentrotus purpuratus TaxID=7668 RepID=A0A7M7HMY5_STRPU|nr:collagen triple helix repeat-containing protein 1 [Strongylocentrotus purpuratus]